MTVIVQERQDLNRLHYLYVHMLAVQLNRFTATAFSLGLSTEVRAELCSSIQEHSGLVSVHNLQNNPPM